MKELPKWRYGECVYFAAEELRHGLDGEISTTES